MQKHYLSNTLLVIGLFLAHRPAFSLSTPKIVTTQTELLDFPATYQHPGQTDFLRSLLSPPVVILDQNWNWVCQLCEEEPSIDQNLAKSSPFQMISHWRLKEGMQWMDGRPVTAKDVKYTIDHIFNSAEKTKKAKQKRQVTIVLDKKNPLRFTVQFRKARADYMQALSLSLIPEHRSQTLKEDENLIKKNLWANLKPRTQKLVIDRLKSYQYGTYYINGIHSSYLALTHHTNYFAPHNHIDKVHFHLTRSAGSMQQMLAQNQVDIIVDGAIDQRFVEDNEQILRNYRVQSAPGKYLEQLVFNLNNPALADVNLRKALFMGIDRDKLLDEVYFGHGKVASSILSPKDSPSIDPDAPRFDLKKAQTYLKRSGWHIDAKDQLRRKDGRVLSIEILSDKSSTRKKIVRFIARSWKKLGILVTHKTLEQQKLMSALQHRRFSDVVICAFTHFPRAQWASRFHTRAIPTLFNLSAGLNFMGWSNRKIDRILKTKPTNENISSIEKKLNQTIFEELPIVPLVFKPQFLITSERINNIEVSGHFFPSSVYSSTWQINENQNVQF